MALRTGWQSEWLDLKNALGGISEVRNYNCAMRSSVSHNVVLNTFVYSCCIGELG